MTGRAMADDTLLSDAERARLAALAALMIPGDELMPGAAALALHGTPVDTVLRIDPTRIRPLRGFLALPGAVSSLAEVEALAQRDPDGFAALGVVLANACFMHPDTRAAIGYPGQEARDSSAGLSDADLALLAEVQARPGPARDL